MNLAGNKDSSDVLASHALTFMFAGISSRWKQTLQYEFTGNSYSADEVLRKIDYLIIRAATIGVQIRNVHWVHKTALFRDY